MVDFPVADAPDRWMNSSRGSRSPRSASSSHERKAVIKSSPPSEKALRSSLSHSSGRPRSGSTPSFRVISKSADALFNRDVFRFNTPPPGSPHKCGCASHMSSGTASTTRARRSTAATVRALAFDSGSPSAIAPNANSSAKRSVHSPSRHIIQPSRHANIPPTACRNPSAISRSLIAGSNSTSCAWRRTSPGTSCGTLHDALPAGARSASSNNRLAPCRSSCDIDMSMPTAARSSRSFSPRSNRMRTVSSFVLRSICRAPVASLR